MHTFLQRMKTEVKGTLSGLDRVRFRGTIRWLASLRGLGSYLGTMRVLLMDFKGWAMGLTEQMGEATERLAEAAGRPVVCLPSSNERKETRAMDIARADGVTEGLIAVLKCVEPCHTFTVGKNAAEKRLELRQHPAHQTMFTAPSLDYYWSAEETEWATDVLFRSPAALAAVYPNLLRHATTTFGSRDVLRFPGQAPVVHRNTTREIISSTLTRPEGTRVKHAINRNSIKMYDKQQSVLRVETTINDPRDMKVYRPKEGDPAGPKSWQRLRKGVADLHRRAGISQKSNERHLEALAAVDHDQPLGEVVRPVCQPTEFQGRRVRALQPLAPDDNALLATVIRGEFALNGFRNRDLRPLLFGTAPSAQDPEWSAAETKRQSSKITRLIRLLRAHGLIQKVPKTHRYTLNANGRQTITALQTAQRASPQQLNKLAV